MSEHIKWKEVENFDVSQETESLQKASNADGTYTPEELVRVYIQLEADCSIQEIVKEISEEVLKEDYFEIHNDSLGENLITADIVYGKIESIKQVEGVASIEVVKKAQLTKKENRQESFLENTKEQLKEEQISKQKAEVTRINVDSKKQETETTQTEIGSQEKIEGKVPVFGIVIIILIVVFGAVWKTKKCR